MSYWARTVIVPLLVLCALKPRRAQPARRAGGRALTCPAARPLKRALPGKCWWKTRLRRARRRPEARSTGCGRRALRQRAIQACVAFVVERLNGEDGLGAIYPAMANSVMMFDALGYAPDHPHRAHRPRSRSRSCWSAGEDGEVYCQPCVSPVWDTALAAHAMLEAGGEAAEAAATRGLDWLKPRQVLDVKGDWADARPDVRPGGWAFQYGNDHYPDLDDTAVVVMAMDRARGIAGDRFDEAIARGVEWTVGPADRRTAAGAPSTPTTCPIYLNNIPFADHGALLDPPTADVTARVRLDAGAARRAARQPAR